MHFWMVFGIAAHLLCISFFVLLLRRYPSPPPYLSLSIQPTFFSSSPPFFLFLYSPMLVMCVCVCVFFFQGEMARYEYGGKTRSEKWSFLFTS